jgi:hypothetical protein
MTHGVQHKVCDDTWVVGDEPVVVVDWYGASNYAHPHAS